jgi:hypothetical protein
MERLEVLQIAKPTIAEFVPTSCEKMAVTKGVRGVNCG